MIRREKLSCNCDKCGEKVIFRKELVLRDDKWEEIVGKLKLNKAPKNTLLCPECIEDLYGGVVKLEDLLHYWGGDKENLAAVPMNYWYMKIHGMLKEARPYIIKHIDYFSSGSNLPGKSKYNCWIDSMKIYKKLQEKGFLKTPPKNR